MNPLRSVGPEAAELSEAETFICGLSAPGEWRLKSADGEARQRLCSL